ncbi:hypothetical protein PTT_03628, partial [Pyrenophora teres f. teres 0-1]
MADVQLRHTPPGFVIRDFANFPPKSRAVIADKVVKLEKKVFPAIEHFNYDVELKKKNIGLLLAFEESDADTLVAYLVYQRMKRIAWLHKLCVVEQEREKGLGKSLIHSLRRHMEKGGCHTIFFAMGRFLAYMPLLPLLACATPQVNYPLNLQYPPVARIGAPFSFQFAPTTFSSASGNLQYSLVGNPPWLSLDGDSRTLSGTPQADDVGIAKFAINAAGQGGAVASMESQLLISAADEPMAKDDVSAALSAAGEVSRHNTVSIRPSKSFNISFPSDTFDSHGIALSYYALLENRTPLPAWISFDSSSISFAGTTPPTTYPQAIQIVLIASEAPGFSASSVSFTMVVSEHTLVFKPSSQTISVAQGQDVQINDLKKDLFLDGSNIGDKDLQSVTAELPSWFSLNNDTITISGTTPAGLKSQDVVITAKSQSGDIAEYTVHVAVQPKILISDIGTIDLTLGEPFKYTIPPTFLAKDQKVTVDLASLAGYLQFDSSTGSISGTVPAKFTPQDVQCSLTAASDQGSNADSQNFHIRVSKAATIDPQNTSSGTNSWEHSNDRRKTAIIVGAVIGGIFGVLILVVLTFCLKRRRRLAKSYISPKFPRSPRKSEISQPMFMTWHEWDDTVEQHDEKNKDNHDPFVARTPEHPPRLDLDLPKYHFHGPVNPSGNDQQSKATTITRASRSQAHNPRLSEDHEDSHSLAGSIGDNDTRTLDHFQTSSFGIYDDTAPSQHPPDSMRIPTDLAKRASQSSDTYRKHKRRTTTVYQDQIHRSTGLPVNRRITGMGHGRHTYSLSRTNTNFSSLHRPQSMGSNTTTRRTSTLSITPSAFPQSPLARKHTTLVTTPTEVRRSVRVVPASRRSTFVDGRTVDEKRNSYIRKRASNQSPFFSAGARASTCSYKSPPAFIVEAISTSRSPLSPRNRNTVVRPDDDVVTGAEKEMNDTLTLGEIFGDQAGSPIYKFPGSLRKNRVNRPHTAISPPRDRVVKSYVRPGTAISSDRGSIIRRASTRHSFRAYDLKASLNDLTDSKVFEDADMSDSVYSDEERDIEEAEKRETIKPNEYTLPPLNLDRVDTARNEKRKSKTSKRNSESNSKRQLKRTSERDPTPYYLGPSHEHGGKENASSTYTLGQRSSPIRSDVRTKTRSVSSPSRPRPSTSRHSKATPEARKSHRPSHDTQTKERHSRKSIHSRTQSRHSGPIAPRKRHDRSRTQSSAFPFFDAQTVIQDAARRASGTTSTVAISPTNQPSSKGSGREKSKSRATRDLSGNLTFYESSTQAQHSVGTQEDMQNQIEDDSNSNSDEDEDDTTTIEHATIETLRSSSIGLGASNGRVK